MDVLLELGAKSASLENQETSESPEASWFDEDGQTTWENWNNPIVKAIIDVTQEPQVFAYALQREFGLATPLEFKCTKLPDKNWVEETQKLSTPISITDKLWILPTHSIPSVNNTVNILLNPGLAFGSGTHPTTQLCLKWLSDNITGGETILDYGCGTGILAIAALKLGAGKAIGTDIDPQALIATQNNAELNHVTVSTCIPEDLPPQKINIIVANILLKPLIELAEHFSDRLVPGGRIALSGLLTAQSEKVVSVYKPYFKNLTILKQDSWGLISGRLKS